MIFLKKLFFVENIYQVFNNIHKYYWKKKNFFFLFLDQMHCVNLFDNYLSIFYVPILQTSLSYQITHYQSYILLISLRQLILINITYLCLKFHDL